MKVWVLTREHNDYDQHGAYFEAVFKNKPTLDQLAVFVYDYDEAQNVLDNKGRINYAQVWYNLEEVEAQ